MKPRGFFPKVSYYDGNFYKDGRKLSVKFPDDNDLENFRESNDHLYWGIVNHSSRRNFMKGLKKVAYVTKVLGEVSSIPPTDIWDMKRNWKSAKKKFDENLEAVRVKNAGIADYIDDSEDSSKKLILASYMTLEDGVYNVLFEKGPFNRFWTGWKKSVDAPVRNTLLRSVVNTSLRNENYELLAELRDKYDGIEV